MGTAVAHHVLVAPDKFKGSATASEVAEHVAAGIRRAAPQVRTTTLPVADGGDGTVDAAVAAGFTRHEVTVTGPLGDPVRAAFAVRGDTAVIEMAEASGLRRLPGDRLSALDAGTYGTGELIRAAWDAGAFSIVLGVGGSASTDGGAGMLTALGARLLDERGDELPSGGGALTRLANADLSALDGRLSISHVVLASDVDNPLLGKHGAAAIYAPQKGARPDDVAHLESGLARFVSVLSRTFCPEAAQVADEPGAGAAGGIGFAALAALGADRRSGIEVLLEVLGFEEALADATYVITGEGRLDEQTLHGKAPAGVAHAAQRRGLPVAAVCGLLELTPRQLDEAGFAAAYALSEFEPDPKRSMAEPLPILERLGERLAAELLLDA